MKRLGGASAVVLAVAAVAAITPSTAAAWQPLVTVDVPSLKGNVDTAVSPLNATDKLQARVLLPDGYDANPTKRYPVIYLLHGAAENWTGWTDPRGGNAAVTLASLQTSAILVMPEAGRGFYTDWWRDGTRNGSNWERYYLDELVPYFEQHFRIAPGRANHAIGGLSMGGYGGAALAAQLPTYFGNILSLSGQPLALRSFETVTGFQARKENTDYNEVWGAVSSPYTEVHDPLVLASSNLASERMYMYYGNGVPDWRFGFDINAWTIGSAAELAAWKQGNQFAQIAKRAGAAVNIIQRSSGVHAWDYWRREMPLYSKWGPFGAPPITQTSQATSWTYKTMAPHGNAWGIAYTFDQPTTSIATFKRVGNQLTGTGSGSVRIAVGAADWDASGDATTPACTVELTLPFSYAIPAGC